MKMESGNSRTTRIVGSIGGGSIRESRMKNEHQIKGGIKVKEVRLTKGRNDDRKKSKEKDVGEVIIDTNISKSDMPIDLGHDKESKSELISDSIEGRDSIVSTSSSSSNSSSKSRDAMLASPSRELKKTRSEPAHCKIKMITNSSPLIRKTKSEPNNGQVVVFEEEDFNCLSGSSSTLPQPNVSSSPSLIEFNPLGIINVIPNQIQSGLLEASSLNQDHDPHFNTPLDELNLNDPSGDGDGDKTEVVGDGSEIEVGNNSIGENTSLDNIIKENNNNEIKATSVVSKSQVIKRPSTIVTSNGVRKSFPTLKKSIPTPSKPFNNSTNCESTGKESTQKSSNNEVCKTPECHGRFQSVVDLVMWKDVSRSAFVFGIGSFFIISSSYAKDVNISLISGVSYVGLVYLAITFMYRSILCRGMIEDEGDSSVIGEDEAVWMLKLILPYINELLSKTRHLFSGDPALTIKMAFILFVLARCGNSITICKVIRLGFFGVFVIPKLCSSYSTHMIAYAKFWVQRIHDVWRSCSHKKLVAFAIFTLVWNCSSIVARTWAAFMLFVAMRYYQQSLTEACNSAQVEDDHTKEVQEQHKSKMPLIIRAHQYKDKKSF